MQTLLVYFVLGTISLQRVVLWQPSPVCDGAKHAHWLDCKKSYSCTNSTNVIFHNCDNDLERFDATSGQCTTNYTGSATCLSDKFSTEGVVETSDGMRFYRSGSGSECIVFNYDIAGFYKPRTKLICDLIARQGYQVILPDYFQGQYYDARTMGFAKIGQFTANQSDPVKLKDDIENKVFPYGAKLNCKSYKAVGTCWGSYATLLLSRYPDVKAGISIHPSHPNMLISQGVNVEEFLTSNVKCPQLYLVTEMNTPYIGDHPSLKNDGSEKKILGSKVKIIEFPLMLHGWTTGGNMSVPTIRSGILKAMNDMMDFLKNTPPQFNGAANMKYSSVMSMFPAAIILWIINILCVE